MNDTPHLVDGAAAWLAGGGEMGERIRRFDWTSSPLGAPAMWPPSLRSAVSILLPSKAQICLFWGPELTTVYNDAYVPVLGEKHPAALGRPAREVWREIWSMLSPLFDGVLATGEAFHATDRRFDVARHGFTEETYFDVSYDPVRDDSGAVRGVFCIVSETTRRVLSERRLRALRDLSSVRAGQSAAEACRLALPVVAACPRDIPFAVLYLVDPGSAVARCVGSVGVAGDPAAGPADVRLDDPASPFAAVARSGRAQALSSLPVEARVTMPGSAARDRTLLLPILRGAECVGLVLAGTSRRLPLDGAYRDFLDLAAAQIATAVTQAEADRQAIVERVRDARRDAEEETSIVETINRIGQRLAEERELAPLVQSFTDEATKLAGAQFGAFFSAIRIGSSRSCGTC